MAAGTTTQPMLAIFTASAIGAAASAYSAYQQSRAIPAVHSRPTVGHIGWKCCHCGSVKDSTAQCGNCGSSQATPVKVDGMALIAARPFAREAQGELIPGRYDPLSQFR